MDGIFVQQKGNREKKDRLIMSSKKTDKKKFGKGTIANNLGLEKTITTRT